MRRGRTVAVTDKAIRVCDDCPWCQEPAGFGLDHPICMARGGIKRVDPDGAPPKLCPLRKRLMVLRVVAP